MTPEFDIWRSAKVMVDRYGEDAPVQAAMRADQLAGKGDMEGRAVWLRIGKAIDSLLSKERPPGQAVN